MPEASAAAGGITDVDILQFALTAEHLESAFYEQGFQMFPASDFMALGLNEADIAALQKVGETEATHVSLLLSAIAGAGFQPVAPCEYDFGFTDAAAMVQTAGVLEAVGVAAYLGAAPLVTDPAILSTAASIVTVEGRHQTFIRSAQGVEPIPGAFDTALGVRGVFTLASPFIVSCPEGSNLNIEAFPAIELQNAANVVPGVELALAEPAIPEGAMFCAFMNQGGVLFEAIEGGSCVTPQQLAGEVFMMFTSEKEIADDFVLAG
ncbi:ferritin-like domain-containing protein [Lineolata rhizophorae]|uniref:Ferritin-like domain-containing protein n=1 Tax=Lineolata rhizophorae TaxID=578093 RepID=A0A6A6PAP9_9PEZI|nr:ferritin-like domain-containing protein [Lineolata rhizophorae]